MSNVLLKSIHKSRIYVYSFISINQYESLDVDKTKIKKRKYLERKR